MISLDLPNILYLYFHLHFDQFPSLDVIDSGLNSLVGANTGGFQSLGTQLFILVGDQVNAERELVDICLLTTEIEDTNLWVGNTTVETGLWVRL